MVAFVHELILLCSSEAGRKAVALSAVSSQDMDKQKPLCLCEEDWQAQPPLSDQEIVLLQMEMKERCFLCKCDIYTFKKVEFINTSAGSASSKG